MSKRRVSATKLLRDLESFIEKRSTMGLRKGKFYSACLRASFVKAFEFVDLSFKRGSNNSYFIAPALRGITEDIIFLRFLSVLTPAERETVVSGLMSLEVYSRLTQQSTFFRLFRPVLHPGNMDKSKIENSIQDVFRKNGWPNLNKTIPSTIELAKKSDPGVLEVVYEFIYRLSFGLVHFSPQVLLRSGWGPTKSNFKFTTKNMETYYKTIAQIYGGFVFCLYFEFFGRYLKPDISTKETIQKFREHLLFIFRWPEMITFEEMNQSIPQPDQFSTMTMFSLYTVMFKEGFIQGAGADMVYKKQVQSTAKASADL